jgi:hypothetical protein
MGCVRGWESFVQEFAGGMRRAKTSWDETTAECNFSAALLSGHRCAAAEHVSHNSTLLQGRLLLLWHGATREGETNDEGKKNDPKFTHCDLSSSFD